MSEKVEKKRGRKPIEYKQPIVQKTFRLLKEDVEPVTKLVVNYMKKNSKIDKWRKLRSKK
jgi:hypothetical protein